MKIILFFLFLFLPSLLLAEETICLVCHEHVNQERISATYIHIGECTICHISDGSDNPHGQDLQPSEITQVVRCQECHIWQFSHPMIKVDGAKELPLLNDIMTCVTCHTLHASSHKYMTRLGYDRDLCIVCHTKYR